MALHRTVKFKTVKQMATTSGLLSSDRQSQLDCFGIADHPRTARFATLET
jgi:hypothetical protein